MHSLIPQGDPKALVDALHLSQVLKRHRTTVGHRQRIYHQGLILTYLKDHNLQTGELTTGHQESSLLAGTTGQRNVIRANLSSIRHFTLNSELGEFTTSPPFDFRANAYFLRFGIKTPGRHLWV